MKIDIPTLENRSRSENREPIIADENAFQLIIVLVAHLICWTGSRPHCSFIVADVFILLYFSLHQSLSFP